MHVVRAHLRPPIAASAAVNARLKKADVGAVHKGMRRRGVEKLQSHVALMAKANSRQAQAQSDGVSVRALLGRSVSQPRPV